MKISLKKKIKSVESTVLVGVNQPGIGFFVGSVIVETVALDPGKLISGLIDLKKLREKKCEIIFNELQRLLRVVLKRLGNVIFSAGALLEVHCAVAKIGDFFLIKGLLMAIACHCGILIQK